MDNVYVDENIGPVLSKLEERDTFALDIETTGLNPHDSRILLCQLGFDDQSFVINPAKVSLEPLVPYITNWKWRKVIHNAKFEGAFFQHFFKADINNTFDTQIAEMMLFTDRNVRYSLEAVALKYLGKALNKEVRKTFFGMRPMAAFTDEQIEYAADDVRVLIPIMEKQMEKLHSTQQQKIADLEFELTTVTAAMELEGLPIDVDKWKALLRKNDEEYEASRLRMHEILFDSEGGLPHEQMGMFVRDGINLASPKQVKAAFLKIGIDVDTTNEREIALINHPAAKELLVFRGLEKIRSSYGQSFIDKIHPFTGRLHPDFQQVGTETGRFSCRAPNVQQIPGDFRECVGLKDYKIIAADYSQMELRILAQLSKEPLLISAFNSGKDLHKNTAAIMFNLDMDDVTKEQRFIAKTLNFGITYGMGPDKLRDILNAEAEKHGWKRYTLEKATSLHETYKKTYNVATGWLKKAGYTGMAQGYAETIMGRRRYLAKPVGLDEDSMRKRLGAIRRQASNTPVQGSNADITKVAMVSLYGDLKRYGFRAKIINQVHDEIVVLAHNSQAEAVKEMVRESMVESAEAVITEVPVKVDVTVSDFWQKG